MLSGCGTINKTEYYDQVESTDLINENLKSVTIGSSVQEIEREFGEPRTIHQTKNPEATYYNYGDSNDRVDLEFKVVDNSVERYVIYSSRHESARSIRIGHSIDEVIQAYGDHYYERKDTGMKIIGYYDHINHVDIEFGIDDELVRSIMVSGTR